MSVLVWASILLSVLTINLQASLAIVEVVVINQ